MSQIFTFILPDLGEGIHEGEVVKWLKKTGETVEENEPIVTLLTDKATVDLPSTHSGKLLHQYHLVGEVAKTGNPLFDLAVSSHQKISCESRKEEFDSTSIALPKIRQLAKSLNIDINLISGTGKGGRVTEEDILKFQSEQNLSKKHSNFEFIEFDGIKQQMQKKMMEAYQNIPHFSYFEQFNVSKLVSLKNAFKENNNSFSYMPFFIKALSLTIAQFPFLNGTLDIQNKRLIIHKHHNIGIAAKISSGLFVPVLKNVQNFSFSELIENYQKLIDQIKMNALKISDMQEGTITISNFSKFGNGLWGTPIINYPEIAILGIAKIQKHPIVENDRIVVSDALYTSWSFDHRVFDGEDAATISQYFGSLLQNPDYLMKS